MDYSFFEDKNYSTLKELAYELDISNYKNKKDLIFNIIYFFKNYENIGKQFTSEKKDSLILKKSSTSSSKSAEKKEDGKPISSKSVEKKDDGKSTSSKSAEKKEDGKSTSSSKSVEKKEDGKSTSSKSAEKKEDGKSTSSSKSAEKKEDGKPISSKSVEKKEDGKPISSKSVEKKEDGKPISSKSVVNKDDGSVKEDKYLIIKQIGNVGKEGVTYLVKRKTDSKEFAMKTFKKTKSKKNILIESELQNIASKFGICPKIIDVDLDNHFIVMDRLDIHLYEMMKSQNGDISKKYQEQIIDIFKKLDLSKVFHADSNILNYMLKNNKLYIIDFGMSKKIDEKLIKKLGDENPNLTYMTLGFVLKLKELKCPPTSYSHLLNYISDENKQKYGIF